MSTNNIGFHEDLTKINFELSSNMHLISSAEKQNKPLITGKVCSIPLLSKSDFKPLAICCICTTQFVSDLVGNPEDRFRCDVAHIMTTVGSQQRRC